MFENLEKAFKHIAYDSGMVNRYNTEKQAIEEMFTNVENRFIDQTWKDVDDYLGTMNEEELENFCCGGEENRDLTSSIARLTDDFINVAFDGE